jgi:hypothetical protein
MVKPVQAKNLFINDQPININHNSTPKQINLIIKSLTTNLPNPINLSSQNSNQNLTLKTLLVTNIIRKNIHLVSAKSIPNFISSK